MFRLITLALPSSFPLSRWPFVRRATLGGLATILWCIVSATADAAGNSLIEPYVVAPVPIGIERVDGARYALKFKIIVTNPGVALSNVTVKVRAAASTTTMVDDTVVIGELPAGRTILSRDVFTVVHRGSLLRFRPHFDFTFVSLPGNTRPVANAGPDQIVRIGSLAALDGTRSTDADGDALTYRWRIRAAPSGSTAQLRDPSSPRPQFQVDRGGTFEFELVVNDGRLDSELSLTRLSTLNSAPVADAGADRTVPRGSVVTLDGSASADIDFNSLSFRWTLVSAPDGSTAALSDANVMTPNLRLDRPGDYTFELVVSDGQLDSAADRITISTENSAPVAATGPDQTRRLGDPITLDGSASTDVDGDALSFGWSFLSRPADSAAVLDSSDLPLTGFTADAPGLYVVQLIVNDGFASSVPGTTTVTIEVTNRPPVANAGADQAVTMGATVALDGQASSDPDADPLTYAWRFLTTPAGSTASLGAPGTATAVFVADVEGLYVIELSVSDGRGGTSTASVTATAQRPNRVPIVNDDTAATTGGVAVAISVLANDADPDGDTLTVQSVTVPSYGTAVIAAGATAIVYTPGAQFAGIDRFSYTITDGRAFATASVSVSVAPPVTGNRPPSVLLATEATAEIDEIITLDASNSADPDGDTLTFAWTLVPGNAPGARIEGAADQATVRVAAGGAGTFVVSLSVSDGAATRNASVVVTVGAVQEYVDRDADGLDDFSETLNGTNPTVADTDGDGFDDGSEGRAGFDPLDPQSRPGVLLPGGDADVAELSATFPSVGPYRVLADDLTADGLALTRLSAMLNPDVSASAVNQLLMSAGARIGTLRPEDPFVTLVVPRASGPDPRAFLEALSAQISASRVFLFVRPAYVGQPRIAPGSQGSTGAQQLVSQDGIRLPAAWNLIDFSDGAAAASRPIRVLVPDEYALSSSGVVRRHPLVSAQQFYLNGAGTFNGGASRTNGNHGFEVVGALAADFDEVAPTGTFPTAPGESFPAIDLRSQPVGGLIWQDKELAIMEAIVALRPDIVSTSTAFPVGNVSRIERIVAALRWRSFVLQQGGSFIHFAAAGNEAAQAAPNLALIDQLAAYDAAWSLAAKRADLESMLAEGTELSEAEREFVRGQVRLLPRPPGMDQPLTNVVIVGSVDGNLGTSSSSEPGSDVSVVGENLLLTCVAMGDGCNGLFETAGGTSFTTPQVAGVAAFLLSLRPQLTVQQLRNVLLQTRNGDVLDAYRALLSLDNNDPGRALRRRLLDVAGSGEVDGTGAQPDGRFDEQDLAEFLSRFAEYEGLRVVSTALDRSRFDLNGDGLTGGDSRAGFDLDFSGGLSGITYRIFTELAAVDETRATDTDILCYAAYSELYAGTASRRSELLGGRCPLAPLLAFKAGGSVVVIDSTSGSGGAIAQAPAQFGTQGVGVPNWRSDGADLAFHAITSDLGDAEIRAYRVTSATTRVVTQGRGLSLPVYLWRETTDGDFMLIQRSGGNGSGVQTVSITAGGSQTQLTNFFIDQGFPRPYANISQQGTVSTRTNEWVLPFRAASFPEVTQIATLAGFIRRDITPVYSGLIFGGYWSPDGQSIAYVAEGNRLLLANTVTLQIRELANDAAFARVSWSPDGRYVAYNCSGDLCAAAVDGSAPLRLTSSGPWFETDPAWSPDGREIAFSRDNDVWVQVVATGAERRLTFTPEVSEEGITWRPNAAAP